MKSINLQIFVNIQDCLWMCSEAQVLSTKVVASHITAIEISGNGWTIL